jgi:AraC family transcriptional regulator
MAMRLPGIETGANSDNLAGMSTNDQSEPIGWDFVPGDPSDVPYGLPYVHGERVSVSFGRLKRSMWEKYSCRRVRLVFTFDDAFGRIDPFWDDGYGGPSWLMDPHQFCFIPPDLETDLDWAHSAELVILYIEPKVFEKCELLPWNLMPKDYRVLARRDHHFADLIRMFLDLCHQSDPPEPEFVEGLATALAFRTMAQFRSLGETTPSARSGLPLEIVNRVMSYIDAHLSEAVTVGDLARVAGLSPDHFARRLKSSTGKSPKRLVLWRQMEKVRELLHTRDFNVTEAGREVGFHDPGHLSRRFRGIFGYPPKAVMKAALTAPGDN